jgi:hypothetical protein
MKTKYKSRPLSPKAIIQLYAEHYLNAPEDKISPKVKREFRELIHSRYTDIKNLGIKEVRVSGQPYKNAEELFSDVEKNRRIQVSTDHNNPVVLDKEGNLQFRFVHDYDHYLARSRFNWEGELTACYYFFSFTNSEILRRILRSEVIYQAAACLYLGDFPETQKLVLSDPRF